MNDFDDIKDYYDFEAQDVADMKPQQRWKFVEFVYDDYKFVLKERMPPPVIQYHRDVLVKLIKTYGH